MPDRNADADAPLVTVAIPTYNRVDQLRVAVASVQAQTHPAIHLVVCDNGSTDGTADFIEGLLAAGQAIQYVRQPRNIGPTGNFNVARSTAVGEYYMWLADDDWLEPEYVEQCVAALEADHTIALATGVPLYWADGVPHHEGVKVQATGSLPAQRVAAYYRQVEDNGTFYGVIPVAVLHRTSPMKPLMGGDWFFLAELAALGQIRTVEAVQIWRDFDPKYTFQQMMQAGGLSPFEGRFPYVAIMWRCAREIATGSTVFRDLGPARFALALRTAAIIARRFVITGLRWRSLRRRLRSARSRLAARARAA